uniref:histone H2A.Z-specific chaperone CHZ1 n=1 Tax=Erigeron canadensis TaxID=72917 RepID=UPI001CB8E270|nr:histone H2A.Z-specific chaperone CHZ1 [Erigeron canadensis]
MTDLNEAHQPNVPLPSKRKPTAEDDEIDTAKKIRPETTPAAAVEEKIINGEKTETENDDEDSEEYEAEDEVGSDDDDSDGEEENTNGKGKGIMKDDKGKGKMIEESDDDSDDGSATDSDGDDDLSDDPLAEVDLDNILPSRTRGRSAANSGLRISSNAADGDDKNVK